MTPEDIIEHHQALATCPGWHSWLEPRIRAQITQHSERSRRDADPVKREESRLTANALEDLLKNMRADFQASLISLHNAGKLPTYMVSLIDTAHDPAPPQPAHQPGSVAPTDFDITTFGTQLIAQIDAQLKGTQPPQQPPEFPPVNPKVAWERAAIGLPPSMEKSPLSPSNPPEQPPT